MATKRRKQQKIQHRIRVTFEDENHVDAVTCAMIGQGYDVSMAESNLSRGEVAYRMKLARDIFGLPKGVGFAQQYRQGKSGLAKELREQMLPAIRATVMAKLVKARKHPTPKVAEATK